MPKEKRTLADYAEHSIKSGAYNFISMVEAYHEGNPEADPLVDAGADYLRNLIANLAKFEGTESLIARGEYLLSKDKPRKDA